jgi:N6-L-threonylcarbamoyladenine synthase
VFHDTVVSVRILGIETSCDETAAAIVEDGRVLVDQVIQSQIDIHKAFGGVVPEVAARSHLEVILQVIDEAFSRAKTDWDGIDAIAVTYAPGLVGSLLIGTLTARTLALVKNKPLIPVHHVEGHVYANFLLPEAPKFPMLALIVSGGHSQLVLFRDHGDYDLLGQTQDDAVGEAFDKVAKIIGLPYPGGPSIAKAAELGDPKAYKFPKAQMKGAYDFSFSGLKTSVLRRVQAECGVGHDFPSFELAARLDDVTRNNIAASFQCTAVETLVDKTIKAFNDHSPASVVIAGGVAANQELRRQLRERLPIPIEYAAMDLCTDNAAMIATLGYYNYQRQKTVDPLVLEVAPSLSM